MKSTFLASLSCSHVRRAVVACACATLLLAGAASASALSGDSVTQMTPPTSSGGLAATLEQCVTSLVQGERSATFAGEMTAVAGTARMAMRIDLQERAPDETEFHFVSASGLGVWRWADPKVKVYKYLKQVTNLSAPAVYRAAVRFRWLNARGHLIRHMERRTPACAQLAPAPTSSTAGAAPSAVG
jgi:hypothetical protein